MAIATGTALALGLGAAAAGQVASSAIGSRAAGKAAKQQQAAVQQALPAFAPYGQVGRQGLTSLAALAGLPGAGGAGGMGIAPGESLGMPSGGDMLAQLQRSPGYQFRLGEGLKALERSAAARGTLLTGGTGKALQRYAQDYASGEYANRFNQLAGFANMGLDTARQQADLLTQGGNAAAAGTIGSANAWQQGLGGLSNLAQQYYLGRLFSGGEGGGYGTVTPPYPGYGVLQSAPGGTPQLAGNAGWMSPWMRPPLEPNR